MRHDIVFVLVALAAVSCMESHGVLGVGDGDVDGDVDIDANADGDGDTDTDADTDADSDGEVACGVGDDVEECLSPVQDQHVFVGSRLVTQLHVDDVCGEWRNCGIELSCPTLGRCIPYARASLDEDFVTLQYDPVSDHVGTLRFELTLTCYDIGPEFSVTDTECVYVHVLPAPTDADVDVDVDSDVDDDADSDGDGDGDGDGDVDGDVDIDADADGDLVDPCCAPGSERWCEETAYGAIGTQTCVLSIDGWPWWGSTCEIAEELPEECADIAVWYSPDFERCLVVSGYCAQDLWDIDHDRDSRESLGECETVPCP